MVKTVACLWLFYISIKQHVKSLTLYTLLHLFSNNSLKLKALCNAAKNKIAMATIVRYILEDFKWPSCSILSTYKIAVCQQYVIFALHHDSHQFLGFYFFSFYFSPCPICIVFCLFYVFFNPTSPSLVSTFPLLHAFRHEQP